MRREMSVADTIRLIVVASLIVLPAIPLLEGMARGQRETDYDHARTAEVSSRGGLNSRVVLRPVNAAVAGLDLYTRDEGLVSIPLPITRGTSWKFYNDRGERLAVPSSSAVNDCWRLSVDGRPVGVRGEAGSVVCSSRGSEIVWGGN